jgi:hypothetical protein
MDSNCNIIAPQSWRHGFDSGGGIGMAKGAIVLLESVFGRVRKAPDLPKNIVSMPW